MWFKFLIRSEAQLDKRIPDRDPHREGIIDDQDFGSWREHLVLSGSLRLPGDEVAAKKIALHSIRTPT